MSWGTVFMEKSLFDAISIRGRLAYGVTCLEGICQTWNVKMEKINLLIETIWEFTLAENLADWDNAVRELLPDDDRIETYANEFGYINLDYIQQEVLTNTRDFASKFQLEFYFYWICILLYFLKGLLSPQTARS